MMTAITVTIGMETELAAKIKVARFCSQPTFYRQRNSSSRLSFDGLPDFSFQALPVQANFS